MEFGLGDILEHLFKGLAYYIFRAGDAFRTRKPEWRAWIYAQASKLKHPCLKCYQRRDWLNSKVDLSWMPRPVSWQRLPKRIRKSKKGCSSCKSKSKK